MTVCLTAASVLALQGCSSGTGSTSPSGSATSTPASTSSPATAIPLDKISATPVGRQLRWVLESLAARSGPTPAEATAHFDAAFLKRLPAQQISAVLAQVRAGGPFTVHALSAQTTSGVASLRDPHGQRILVTLAVDSEGKISSLLLKPAPALPVVTSMASLDAALSGLGINATVALSKVEGTGSGARCVSEHRLGNQDAHPLGSMFKLYVLGALAQAVADGTLTWDTDLAVTEGVKSLPSGQLQDVPDGTKVTVQKAATLMISVSDNTAADLLIGAVGRAAVERQMGAMDGPGDSGGVALLTPFLTTKQLFTLQSDASLRSAWAKTGSGLVDKATGAIRPPPATVVQQRRQIVATIPARGAAALQAGLANPAPIWLDGLGWAATPAEICRAHLSLQRLATTTAGAPVRAILSKNPGVDVGPAWKYVAFKGGSLPGVLAGSWYLEGKDSSRQVLVVQLSAADATKIPDDEWFAAALGGAIRSRG